jgi:hypothetical protein
MRNQHLKRNLLWAAIGTLSVVVMASSSPQCANTGDRSLNPDFQSLAGGNPCIDACNAAFKAGQKAEQARHKAQISFCNGNPVCKQEEGALHDLNMFELVEDKDECKLVCQHEQGSATGGQ